MCAKVKRLCRAMLRFMRSLRNSRGEWRGEFRGESQGDILGDPQGEPDVDWGFRWMGWGLLSGKESASPELSQRASLMLPVWGFNKTWSLTLISYAGPPVLTGSPACPCQSSIPQGKIIKTSDVWLVMMYFILWDTCGSLSSDPLLLHSLRIFITFLNRVICKHCWWTQTRVQAWALPSAVSCVYIALSPA